MDDEPPILSETTFRVRLGARIGRTIIKASWSIHKLGYLIIH